MKLKYNDPSLQTYVKYLAVVMVKRSAEKQYTVEKKKINFEFSMYIFYEIYLPIFCPPLWIYVVILQRILNNFLLLLVILWHQISEKQAIL